MSDKNDEDTLAAAIQALSDELPSYCDGGCAHDPKVTDAARAVLDAVAPIIAARALREAASRIDTSDPEGDEWSTNDLRAYADALDAEATS